MKTKKVMNALTRSYGAVRKEVSSIMGGRVLEYDAKTIRNKALADGEKEGRKEGQKEGRKEGRKEAGELLNFLWSNGRGEDALKASSDENYLKQLLEEFQSGKLTIG